MSRQPLQTKNDCRRELEPASDGSDAGANGSGDLQSVSIRAANPGRRGFLAMAAAATVMPLAEAPAAVQRQIVYPERSLSLNSVHTGESEKIVYWADGTYLPEGLNRINWILRDFRTSETKSIDPRLLNILYLLMMKLESDDPVLVLSGYRSKRTNDMLRRTTEGVARRSFHMAGSAIDIRMPRVATQHVQRAALQLGGGGVGYYPSSNFVHLDSGPVRTW